MKQFGSTIAMAVLLAGLGAYMYFVELPAEHAKMQTQRESKKLLPFAERDITGLTIKAGPEGTVVVLARDDDRKWKITAPLQTDADSREVDALLRALALGTVARIVEEQAGALGAFGLDPPALTVTVTAGANQDTIALGDIGPITSTLYALRASDKKVLLTDLPPKTLLSKSLQNLRKKEIFPIPSGVIERLRLSNPKTEIVLYRAEGKGKARWHIRFPMEAKADQPEVRNLLIKLEDLKALGFVDAAPEKDALMRRLTVPLVKVTTSLVGGDYTMKLYQPDASSGEAYAVTTLEAPIYKINPTAIQDFTKDLFTMQDKRLLGVEADEIAMLSVKTRDQHYSLIHQNNDWVLEDDPTKKLDQEVVALFISRVVDLPAELRVVREAGPLAPYGLSSPAAMFAVTTKDGKTKGKLLLGNPNGGLVYAIGQGLNGIYQARADLLHQIPAKESLFIKPGSAKAAP